MKGLIKYFRQAAKEGSVGLLPRTPRSAEEIVGSVYFREGYPVLSRLGTGGLYAITSFRPSDKDGGCQAQPTPSRITLRALSGQTTSVVMGNEQMIWVTDTTPEGIELMKKQWVFEGWLSCGYSLKYTPDPGPNFSEKPRQVLIVEEGENHYSFVHSLTSILRVSKENFSPTGRQFLKSEGVEKPQGCYSVLWKSGKGVLNKENFSSRDVAAAFLKDLGLSCAKEARLIAPSSDVIMTGSLETVWVDGFSIFHLSGGQYEKRWVTREASV